MEDDEIRSPRCFETPEWLDGEAELVSAGLSAITRRLTDLAKRFGLASEYKLFAKYMTGGRGCPLWIVSAMRDLAKSGDPTDEKSLAFAARSWCVAFARALVQPLGYTITPAARRGEVVLLIAQVDTLASEVSGNTMRDLLGDGKLDAVEASARLPEVQALKRHILDLEAGLIAAAAQGAAASSTTPPEAKAS